MDMSLCEDIQVEIVHKCEMEKWKDMKCIIIGTVIYRNIMVSKIMGKLYLSYCLTHMIAF